MSTINSLITLLSKSHFKEFEYAQTHTQEVQEHILKELLRKAKDTEYGKRFHFNDIHTIEQFQKKVPLVHYEDISPYIQRMLEGQQNILWPDTIHWFAKSSGTTDNKSKYIPVSQDALYHCHYKASKDVLFHVNRLYPNNTIFKGKTLILGGSKEKSPNKQNYQFGDLSAILIQNTPFWINSFKTPTPDIMLMNEWEAKLEKICQITQKQDVRCLAGVPSWFLMLINRLLDITGKDNLSEIWPNLELFIHGGVNFGPYREQYRKIIPSEGMHYFETYNASEGFFAIQDDPNDTSMSFLLNHGIYYEFIPTNQLHTTNPPVVNLTDVQPGINYAIVITTNGGLWRYIIGDTILFTSIHPYKFRITGRTKLFINAFGEEIIIDNATQALEYACNITGASVREYTVAPIFMEKGKKGAHQWLIEFAQQPKDITEFGNLLDRKLQEINSDYEAKRYKNMSLGPLQIVQARKNLFNDWLKNNGKLGGQHKVPQLCNNRDNINQLLIMN